MDPIILYVIAGPNGIGKTTSTFDIVPKGIPIINSDEISKQVIIAGIAKVNTQEYANREALKLVKEHLESKVSFAIETNLADRETWKFLIDVKKTGYQIYLIYLCTDDLTLLNKRIKERSLRGEHYVLPSIVEERYIASLKLLNHYFTVPDEMDLIDNSENLKLIVRKKTSKIEVVAEPPNWVKNNFAEHFTSANEISIFVKDLNSTEAVRNRYEKIKKNSRE